MYEVPPMVPLSLDAAGSPAEVRVQMGLVFFIGIRVFHCYYCTRLAATPVEGEKNTSTILVLSRKR